MKHSVKEYKLKNGAKGLVVNVPGTSVVGLSAVFNSGFYFASKAKFEVPHVMEHMMESGNKKFPSAVEFKGEVEKNGAYHNASTGGFLNTYDYECAAFESSRIIQMLGCQLSSPLFPEAAFRAEVGNVREELSLNTSNYGRLCLINLRQAVLPHYMLAEEIRIEQLGAITLGDVTDYYKRTHAANNLRFFVVGDFRDEGREIVRLFDESIADLAQGERLEFGREEPMGLDKPLVIRQPIKQLYYTLEGYVTEVNYRQRLAAQILSSLLTGGYRSWVRGPAREKGLAYHVASGFSLGPYVSHFNVSAFVTPANARELFELIAGALVRVCEGRLTEGDIEEVKAMIIGRVTRRHQTAGDVMGWYAGDYAFDDTVLDFQNYLDDLQGVTVREVVEMARFVAKRGVWGLSLVGDIDEKEADNLYKKLQSIWLH
jgi:predicted Zn-dependent peptidase